MIVPQDNFNHPIGPEWNWNESRWFSVSVPERQLHGFIYWFFRPNMKLVVGGPVLWDRPGATMADCLHYNWHWLQSFDRETDGVNAALPGGLSLESAGMGDNRFRYAVDGCAFDLHWTAIAAPHASSATDPTSKGHYELPGRISGWMELENERFAVDCWSMSDHSWGPRAFGDMKHGVYSSGIADQDFIFNVLAFDSGARNRVVDGFLHRDGATARLTEGEVWAEGRDGLRALEMVIDARDALGRSLRARGRTINSLDFCGYPRAVTSWTMIEWETEGRTFWGEQQEFFPRADAAATLRAARWPQTQ